MAAERLLKVENLTLVLKTREGEIVPVREVSFTLGKGESVGLVYSYISWGVL